MVDSYFLDDHMIISQEIIHLPGYAESDPHRVVEKHIGSPPSLSLCHTVSHHRHLLSQTERKNQPKVNEAFKMGRLVIR